MASTTIFVPATGTFPAHNLIIGTPDPEPIFGTAITDIIVGLAGNDHLFGGDGDDFFAGGPGADGLTGGPGSDVFIFSIAAEAHGDWIGDFDEREDFIYLVDIDANSSIAGDQAFTWNGTAPFTAEGQLRYVQQSGNTFIQGNTGGDLLPEFTIGVKGLVNFAAVDFYL
jgi:Ca2+-binding RTX toxin-like protein